MANFNKVILIGNLTKDPELRYTPQGVAVVNLRLAVNTRFRDRNQELKEETCFVTAVVWNKQAETSNQYLHKGSPVMIEGRLQSRSWEDSAGQKRSVLEIRADRVQFLGGPPKAASEPPTEQLPEPSTEATWLEDPSDGRQESEDKSDAT